MKINVEKITKCNIKECKVLIADEHPFIRLAVKHIFSHGNYKVVAEANSGIEAVELAKKHCPELVVLDISTPKLDGLGVIGRLREISPHSKVLILTSMPEEHYVLRSINSGAAGYLSKRNEVDLLLRAADAIMSGYTFFPSRFAKGMQGKGSYNEGVFTNEHELLSKLSQREMTVLRKLVSGVTVGEIARELMLSNKTISTYKARLLSKLNLKSIIHLSELAKRNNL